MCYSKSNTKYQIAILVVNNVMEWDRISVFLVIILQKEYYGIINVYV